MSPLSREAILAVLSGLTVLGCDKTAPTTQAVPEPLPSSAAAPGSPAPPAADAAVAAPAPSASASPSAAAKEVKPAAGKPADKPAEKEMGCAPGACAPGKCGANK